MDSLLAYDTQAIDGTKERQDVLKLQWGFGLWRLIFSQEGLEALIAPPPNVSVARKSAAFSFALSTISALKSYAVTS